MITVENLTKSYGTRRAVDHLSFDVQPGRVTGFVGPNGSGKSTTMRMMVGLTRPDDGHVHDNGTAYHQLDRPVATIALPSMRRRIRAGPPKPPPHHVRRQRTRTVEGRRSAR